MRKDAASGQETSEGIPALSDKGLLVIEGLRQNNLKNISLKIPHDKITVIAGLSGSGKSSLAFDTLFAEGRWRFMESLSTYTRLFLEKLDRPDADKIKNIRPAIALEQKNPVRTSRSTVGTAAGINDYLRVVFANIGKLHCPKCSKEITRHDPPSITKTLLNEYPNEACLIGFTIKVKDANAGDVFAELIKKGFIRIKHLGNILDIAETPHIKGREIMVIADRMVLRPSEEERFREALETSFKEGSGRAWVGIGDKEVMRFTKLLECADCEIVVEKPAPLLFSFNHPVGACPECKGFGNVLKRDEDKIIPDKELTLRQGAIAPWTKPSYRRWYEELARFAPSYRIDVNKKFSQLSAAEKKLIFKGTKDFDGIDGFFEYLEKKKYKLHIRVFLSRYLGNIVCPFCKGTRLNEKALQVKIHGLDIAQISKMTVKEVRGFFSRLTLTPFERDIAKEALRQIEIKLEFMDSTGIGYLTLCRLTKTLSGGESQRVSLSNQLASALSGVLYILDEPSIGLHPKDVSMLIRQIEKLSARKNTVVLVEHDPLMINSSDYIVELGPGSGSAGGRVVYSGTLKDFMASSNTLTAQYLTGRKKINTPSWRRKGKEKHLVIKGARGNNLKAIDVRFPLYTMTCVTGVSGSGKSSLVIDTLYNALAERFSIPVGKALPYDSIEGAKFLSGVKFIDQEPIGRTTRSNPITYIKGFDEIRRFFSTLAAAKSAGLTSGSFSFNVPGGRCEECKGEGQKTLDMYFLPDVYITCPACGGKRYKPQILEVRYNGKNIRDILDMTFDDASGFFSTLTHCSAWVPRLVEKISLLRDVGLGYLKLGQPAATLSGGERERLKIARELSQTEGKDSLYILDEPTTGLHPEDIKKLLNTLSRLVDAGNTVIVIEHNLDLIKTADYIIDLGPEGGAMGGYVITVGTPEEVGKVKESHTGRYLKDAL